MDALMTGLLLAMTFMGIMNLIVIVIAEIAELIERHNHRRKR